jgi:phage baseplate assembly protein W
MNPEFGSGLWNILFENFSDDITPLIENTIRKDIIRWMSYVNVDSVQVNADDSEYKDKYKVGVTVLFTIPSIGITDPQTLEVSMNTENI